MGHGLGHAPRAARRAEPAALAAEGQQLVVPALGAAKPQETVRQDAALEKGVELVHDEPRQLAAGAGFGVGDEAGRLLLHQPVQRCLLRSMPPVVDRGAIGRPLGLPADGLHDGLRSGVPARCQAGRDVSIALCAAPKSLQGRKAVFDCSVQAP